MPFMVMPPDPLMMLDAALKLNGPEPPKEIVWPPLFSPAVAPRSLVVLFVQVCGAPRVTGLMMERIPEPEVLLMPPVIVSA